MTGRRAGVAVAVGLLLATVLTGCWDQRPIESRAAITILAVDPGPRPGDYRYTFGFPNVTTTPTSLAAPSASQLYAVQVNAASLGDALQQVRFRQSRALYLGQVRLVVLSTHLPPAVWTQTLNAMVQSGRMVLTFWLLGTPTASALATLAPPTEAVPEVAVYHALTDRSQPVAWSDRGWRAWVDSVTPGVSLWVPAVTVQHGHFALGRMDVWSAQGIRSWSAADMWGWAYLTGRVRDGTLHTQVGHRPVTVGDVRTTSRVQYRVTGGGVDVTDAITGRGVLTEGGLNLSEDPQVVAAIDQAASHVVLRQALATLHLAMQQHVDPFGWHRDLRWLDSAAEADASSLAWTHWRIQVTIRFTVRNEGVLR